MSESQLAGRHYNYSIIQMIYTVLVWVYDSHEIKHYRWLEFKKSKKSYYEQQGHSKVERNVVTEKFKSDHNEQKRLVKSVALNLVVGWWSTNEH